MKQISIALSAILVITLSLAGQVPVPGPAVIKNIEYVKTDACLEVSIRIDGDFLHQASVLSSPNRLVIDIAPAEGIEALPVYDINASGVTTIQTSQFQSQISRVIINFSEPIPGYEIRKTDNGLTVKICLAPKPEEKSVSPKPVRADKSVQEAKPVRKEGVSETTGKIEGSEVPPGFFNTTVGLLIGSYKSPDSRFKEVYGDKTSFQYGLNLSRILFDIKGFQVDVSLEARAYGITGKATLSGDETKFRMIPVTFAGRLLFQTKYIIPFAGGGIDWYHYNEESVLANTSGWARGNHFQVGMYIVVPNADYLRVKLYYKYTRVTATANEIDVKLGGPEYGVGLSFGFNFLNGGALVIR